MDSRKGAGGEAGETVRVGRDGRSVSASAAASGPKIDPRVRFLVVDDSSAMRRIVVAALTELGYRNFLEAGNGDEALAQLAAHPVDMVLCDHNMPGMTGMDLLSRLRSEERFHKLPFIMITAEANRDLVVEAVKLGVSNYIIKPFASDVLGRKIRQTLESGGD